MDLIAFPKLKTTKGKGVETPSLAHSILGVEGFVGVSGWGLRRVTSKSIIHTNLHKPKNKLVSA
jgi:hypothetical protein